MVKSAPLRPYFLFSFLPAIAYWFLETYSTIQLALIGGVILGILEMALEKYFTHHIHTISKLNLALILVLGFISFLAHEGVWFRLQPTFTGLALAGFLLLKKIQKKSLLLDMIEDLGQTPPLPPTVYKALEWHITIFVMIFSIFMAKVAVYDSSTTWLFWKTAGTYIVFGAFILFEVIYLRFFLFGRKQ
jgi:intracellular septation protein